MNNLCVLYGKLEILAENKKVAADDSEIRIFHNKKLYSMTITDYQGNFKHVLPVGFGEVELEFVADDFENIRTKAVIKDENVDIGTFVFRK